MNEEKSNNTFADMHPRLNLLVGFIALLVIIGACAFVIVRIIDFIGWSISKLVQVASNLDAVVIVALITGAVSLVSVIVSSIVGKYIEYSNNRRSYLAQKREEAYKSFIEMVYKLQVNKNAKDVYTNDEITKDIVYFSRELSLWGSRRVVNKWIEFRQKITNGEKATDNLFILEDIMNEMRKDMGCKKVQKGKLLAFFINDIKDYL